MSLTELKINGWSGSSKVNVTFHIVLDFEMGLLVTAVMGLLVTAVLGLACYCSAGLACYCSAGLASAVTTCCAWALGWLCSGDLLAELASGCAASAECCGWIGEILERSVAVGWLGLRLDRLDPDPGTSGRMSWANWLA